MSDKEAIIRLFDERVRGRRPETDSFNQRHDGKGGHWLEAQMGIQANSSNSPDLLGYEMKNDTSSKTSFGDWSANYYIFKRNNAYGLSRSEFLRIFGKPNVLKCGRHSWSGEPCHNIKNINKFGQFLMVDDQNNIHAKYSYSKDERSEKVLIVPDELKVDNLTIARWDSAKLRLKVENKFNKKGWFKCLRDSSGMYRSIVFGGPISFETWIGLVKAGDIYFDSGMYDGNRRPYSQWRADNSLWNKLVISKH